MNKEIDETGWGALGGIGRWPPISTCIIPPPLGSNAPHCMQILHEVRKFLLNLVPGEPLALVQELANFDYLIQLDTQFFSSLDMFFHDKIK